METPEETLKALLRVADTKKTMEDFLTAFKVAVDHMLTLKGVNDSHITGLQQLLQTLKTDLKDTNVKDFGTFKSQLKDTIDKALKEQEQGLNYMRDWVRNLPIPQDGHTPTEDELTSLIQKLEVEETGTTLRDKLESLEGEERLDASAIKNLPEPSKDVVHRVIASSTSLWHLQDVDVSGILTGQSIKWDGVRWIPFTPAGGSSTNVYNEVVAGSVNTFTLATSPVSGSERLYANGQRLTPTTDYTIAGAIITTVSSWTAGQITADYAY